MLPFRVRQSILIREQWYSPKVYSPDEFLLMINRKGPSTILVLTISITTQRSCDYVAHADLLGDCSRTYSGNLESQCNRKDLSAAYASNATQEQITIYSIREVSV